MYQTKKCNFLSSQTGPVESLSEWRLVVPGLDTVWRYCVVGGPTGAQWGGGIAATTAAGEAERATDQQPVPGRGGQHSPLTTHHATQHQHTAAIGTAYLQARD